MNEKSCSLGQKGYEVLALERRNGQRKRLEPRQTAKLSDLRQAKAYSILTRKARAVGGRLVGTVG